VLLDITARKEAEALEEQLRELLDSSPVVTYVYESVPDEDPPVRFIHMSQQISQLIGQSVQNLLADYSLWLRQIHPDDLQQLVEASSRSRDTGKPWQRTFRVIAQDGRVVNVLSVGRCVQRDADGTPRRFVGALIDVTAWTNERDRIDAERARLRSLVDGLPGFSWTEVVEGEPGSGRLTFIGGRVEEILGYTADELVSTPGYFDKLVHPDDRRRLDALNVHHDLTEEPWLTEFRSRTRDGRTRWLRSQGLPSRDANGRLVWNGITFDITDERTHEDDVSVIPDTSQIES
jgi:PAS domain S-box-containing protein